MADFCSKLCLLLLEEHFGLIVQSIGNTLLYETKTLYAISSRTGLPLVKVKEGLCVLIKYGFVTYEEDEGIIRYIINKDKIIMLFRYPRYVYFAKTYCGDEGEIMLEEVLKNGYLTASEMIIKTYKRMEQTPSNSAQKPSISNLKNTFELLVKNQFLMRSVSFTTAVETEKPDYNLPELDMMAISNMLQEQNGNPGDNKIYWKVNFDRFTQDFRDQLVIQAAKQRFDVNAGELMRHLINLMYLRTASWAATSNPIPFTEIKEEVKKLNYPELEQYLDQYLRLIEEDSSQFIKRVGDSGGGQYSVNMKNAFKQLAWVTLEHIVAERFGSRASRIFRLVRDEKDVSIEQIQQLAMIPAKEARFLTYTLVRANYVQTQEIKKNGQPTTQTKIPIRFYVNLDKIIGMEIEHCHQALYNFIKRREHESASNKRMIEKQLRVQTLSANMKEHGATEQQLADIAEMMTPSETEQLEKAQKAIEKLLTTELHIDETLFLLTMYLRYH